MRTGRSQISDADLASLAQAIPRAFGRPWRERLVMALGWCAFAGLVGLCLWRMEVTPERLWHGLGKLNRTTEHWYTRIVAAPPGPGL